MRNTILSTIREAPPVPKFLGYFLYLLVAAWVGYLTFYSKNKISTQDADNKPAPSIGTLNATGPVYVNLAQSPTLVLALETTRDSLRTMLHKINPGLLRSIDAGQSRIQIYLTGPTVTSIRKFIKENRAANDYIAVDEGKNNSLISIGGPFETYQGLLIEMVPDGPFRDYFLIPTEQLKIKK